MSSLSPDYGFIVTRPKADEILNYFGITPDTHLDLISGMDVTYEGKEFTIYERDYWMPPSNTSPDGLHFVYSKSPEEVEWEQRIEEEAMGTDFGLPEIKSTIDSVIKLGMLGVVAYLAVNVLGFLKKK